MNDRYQKPVLQLVLLIAIMAIGLLPTARAVAGIMGGEGNKPLNDPGWPTGAAAVVNWPTRIAYWEGPSFGGGEWHAESKGDAAEINKVLAAFADIDSELKQLVIKEGIGYSVWLDPNQSKRADRNTKIDWEFTVWVKGKWDFQKSLPAEFSAFRNGEAAPIPRLTIYNASVNLDDIVIPAGIEVIDQTLAGNGYQREDGRVIEGVVVDANSKQPIQATIQVERVQPQETGGYVYERAENVATDAQGHWVMKNFTTEWSRFMATADGYAPRVIHYSKYDRQPGWECINAALAKSETLAGKVVDAEGNGLSDAQVIIRSIKTVDSTYYELPEDQFTTASDGSYRIDNLPQGRAKLTAHKSGYFGEGLGVEFDLPAEACVLTLRPAGVLEVKVIFPGDGQAVGNYIVSVTASGGAEVGRWGGSGNIDSQNSIVFRDIPPGDYQVFGRPNPGSEAEQTETIGITIQGGKTAKLELKAAR